MKTQNQVTVKVSKENSNVEKLLGNFATKWDFVVAVLQNEKIEDFNLLLCESVEDYNHMYGDVKNEIIMAALSKGEVTLEVEGINNYLNKGEEGINVCSNVAAAEDLAFHLAKAQYENEFNVTLTVSYN